MLEPSSVFYKLQAQLSTWDCKYILLENERQFPPIYAFSGGACAVSVRACVCVCVCVVEFVVVLVHVYRAR